MKPFHINISDEEFEAVAIAVTTIRDPISLYNLSRCVGMNENRLRYIIDEMVKNGTLKKIAIDDRPHHKRYRYERCNNANNNNTTRTSGN